MQNLLLKPLELTYELAEGHESPNGIKVLQALKLDKIQSLLDYQAIVDYKTSLQETVKWIKKSKAEH